MKNKQIKSRNRVSTYGEVFTAQREVNSMLDLVGNVVKNINSTVLEPAVGEGIFLCEILSRRIDEINKMSWNDMTRSWMVLRALSGLYGVDIQPDNVEKCRSNLIEIVAPFVNNEKQFAKMAKTIVKYNITCGNTLTTTTADSRPLKFPEWTFESDFTITRMDFPLQELLDNGGESNIKHKKYTYRIMPNRHITPEINKEIFIYGYGK